MIMLNESKVVESARKDASSLSGARLLYEQSGVQVRKSLKTDRFPLKESDAKEVYYSNGFTPEEALTLSFEKSLIAFTVLIKDKPEIAFGINPVNLLGNDAVIWMLSSDRIKEIGLRFVRHSREYVDYFLSYYSRLWNFVHVENKVSIAWLKRLGARFEDPAPYGLHQKPFMKFHFERKS